MIHESLAKVLSVPVDAVRARLTQELKESQEKGGKASSRANLIHGHCPKIHGVCNTLSCRHGHVLKAAMIQSLMRLMKAASVLGWDGHVTKLSMCSHCAG